VGNQAARSLAVSTVNGCGMCMAAHEKVVRHGGLSQEQVQAVAAVLDGEAAMTG